MENKKEFYIAEITKSVNKHKQIEPCESVVSKMTVVAIALRVLSQDKDVTKNLALDLIGDILYDDVCCDS